MGDKVFHEFEKQKLKWHNRFITVNDKYTARFGSDILSKKFYARHDVLSERDVPQSSVHQYMNVVGKKQVSGPRETYDQPVTENQVYGWLWDKAQMYKDENDRELFYRCRIEDSFLKIQKHINVVLNMDRYYKMLR